MEEYLNYVKNFLYTRIFLEVKNFSDKEIREYLHINNSLKENAKSDIDQYMKAQNILNRLATEYFERIKNIYLGVGKPNLTFDIDNIKFVFNQGNNSYKTTSDGKTIYITTDIINPFGINNSISILHEIIHCLDIKRLKDKGSVNNNVNKVGIEYYTAPLENNAYINELFMYVLQNLINIATKDGKKPEDVFKDERFLAKMISSMLTEISDKKGAPYHDYLSILPEKMQRRVFDRLYNFMKKQFLESYRETGRYLADLKLQLLIERVLINSNKDNK